MITQLQRVFGGIRLMLQRRQINDGRSFNADGFARWHVGDAVITRIVELEGYGFGEFLLPDAKRSNVLGVDWMSPTHITSKGELRLSVHSFMVEVDGLRVLVDANVGNGKRRKVPIWNKLNTPWLKDLERAGFAANTVDIVIATHLHIDHVGWNTLRKDGKWVPTFPRARYKFVDNEYRYWKSSLNDPARAELFEDSIEPVVTAGKVDFVSETAAITPSIRLVHTPGHTEHHVSVLIESRGQRAIITGDFVHHPIQFARPDISSAFDTSPETAAETRTEWFGRIADDRILVLGTAFPTPTAGRIERWQGAYRFLPVDHQLIK